MRLILFAKLAALCSIRTLDDEWIGVVETWIEVHIKLTTLWRHDHQNVRTITATAAVGR